MSAISNPAAIVDIVDVFAQAQSVPVETIMPGDKVFDVFGRAYDVLDVKAGRVLKNGTYTIWIVRSDHPGTWECIGEVGSDYRPTITIIPSIGARTEESE
jgi:hypothetical protein